MQPDKPEIHVLFIGGNASDIDEVRGFLSKSSNFVFHVEHRPYFFDCADLLNNEKKLIDIILVDMKFLDMDDAREVFRRMIDMARGIPIIVFTDRKDHNLAVLAMEEGAADNITKGGSDTDIFKFRDAIEFSLIRRDISRRQDEENARKIRDVQRDAYAELHSVRKSNAADMDRQKDQYADLVEQIMKRGDEDIVDAVHDIGEALALVKLENALLYAQLKGEQDV